MTPEPSATNEDPLGPARGLLIGLAISIAMWGIGIAIWEVFVR